MAHASVVVPPQDIVLTLRLSPEEAERLKSLMQNPLEQDEADSIRNVREAIWHALNEARVVSV